MKSRVEFDAETQRRGGADGFHKLLVGLGVENAVWTFSPLTPALSPLRGEGERSRQRSNGRDVSWLPGDQRFNDCGGMEPMVSERSRSSIAMDRFNDLTIQRFNVTQ